MTVQCVRYFGHQKIILNFFCLKLGGPLDFVRPAHPVVMPLWED